MTTSPGISVIMPVYNGISYIEASIKSAAMQTLAPLEIIVIDDGSKDGSADFAESLPTPFLKHVVRVTNGGQSRARNIAAAMAKGELLAFLDHDDIWHRDHLRRLSEPFANDPDLGWSYCDIDEMDHDAKVVHRCLLRTLNPDVEHPKSSLYNLLADDMFIFPSAAVVRAKAFMEAGGFDERLAGYEDDDLFLRLFRAGWGNVFIPDSLVRYRRHLSSSAFSERMWKSREIYAAKLIEAFPDDRDLSRYWVRDLIAPRFFRAGQAEYIRHMARGREDLCALALDVSCRYSALSKPGLRRRVRQSVIFKLMEHPRLFSLLFVLLRRDPRFGRRSKKQSSNHAA
jgi:glycosyltransferase involved in cell wall biosynthesis